MFVDLGLFPAAMAIGPLPGPGEGPTGHHEDKGRPPQKEGSV